MNVPRPTARLADASRWFVSIAVAYRNVWLVEK
jgi:hypothetical protein